MRKDLVDAVLGMYAAIEHAANAQVAIGHTDQGRRKGITSGKHLDPVAKIIKEDLVKMDSVTAGFMTLGINVPFRVGFDLQRNGICSHLTTMNLWVPSN